MAIYSELSATLRFEDGQTKTVSFSPYNITDSAVSGFKSRTIAINNSISGAFPQINLEGDDGSPVHVSKISAATLTTTDKTVIYAKTESARTAALEMVGDNNG